MSRPAYLVSAIARQRLDEIYSYTRQRWGDEQAEATATQAPVAPVAASDPAPRLEAGALS